VIEQVLYSALSSSSSITALCGNRIYPLLLPTEVTLPAISYRFVDGSSKTTQDTLGNQRYRVEVNCWGATYSDAVTLRAAVVLALSQYNESGVLIQFQQPTDDFDHELLQYRAIAEFYLFANLAA
jgi:hypothetical protein